MRFIQHLLSHCGSIWAIVSVAETLILSEGVDVLNAVLARDHIQASACVSALSNPCDSVGTRTIGDVLPMSLAGQRDSGLMTSALRQTASSSSDIPMPLAF